jgi:NIMA (never in mitosis gene a)-related kinase
MALGLYDIHKRKVLHRDMKTANVFLQSNPDSEQTGHRYLVKIGDLGVAKLLGTSTAFANTVVGTPYYLSPELCQDTPYVREPREERQASKRVTGRAVGGRPPRARLHMTT